MQTLLRHKQRNVQLRRIKSSSLQPPIYDYEIHKTNYLISTILIILLSKPSLSLNAAI